MSVVEAVPGWTPAFQMLHGQLMTTVTPGLGVPRLPESSTARLFTWNVPKPLTVVV